MFLHHSVDPVSPGVMGDERQILTGLDLDVEVRPQERSCKRLRYKKN
jgi:hypothetical protein